MCYALPRARLAGTQIEARESALGPPHPSTGRATSAIRAGMTEGIAYPERDFAATSAERVSGQEHLEPRAVAGTRISVLNPTSSDGNKESMHTRKRFTQATGSIRKPKAETTKTKRARAQHIDSELALLH